MPPYERQISPRQLRNGAIIATLAHAIWVARHPELAGEQSWDGINYNVQDTQGAIGTITFAPAGVVAVFFDANSPRSPFRSPRGYDTKRFFRGIPDELMRVAEAEALQYVIQEYASEDAPIITAAFWGEGDTLSAAEPWSEVFANGAHLVHRQMLGVDQSIVEWQAYYQLTPAQVELLRSLYRRIVEAPTGTINLDEHELRIFADENAAGIEESRNLFASVGVVLPK